MQRRASSNHAAPTKLMVTPISRYSLREHRLMNLEMRSLVSKDDGYLAHGLAALDDDMRPLGEVTVVAPEQNSSGASNSLTLHRPLTISRAHNGFTFINGTPSDCVHIALTGLLDQMPDLIVSGINNGQNM